MKNILERLRDEESKLILLVKQGYDEDVDNGTIDRLNKIIEYFMKMYMVCSGYMNAFTYEYKKYKIVRPHPLISNKGILLSSITLSLGDETIYCNTNPYEYNRKECMMFLDKYGDKIENEYHKREITEVEKNIYKYKNSLI